ncbi:MAG: PilZ domain-containing protein [Deltaproteobacteria bacterium]|nr:PilZ domain-containing protein [Deltaproteobacteria bacterium]
MPQNSGYPFVKQGVRVLLEGAAVGGAQLTAVIDAAASDGKLDLAVIDPAKAALLKPGMTITLEYFREGIVYKLRAPVAEPLGPASGPKAYPRVRLGVPLEVKKIQRRRFPRALVGLDVRFDRVEIPEDFDAVSKKAKKQMMTWAEALATKGATAVTETVSGSGLRMRTTLEVAKGEMVFLRLELPDAGINLLGEVVWQGASTPRESPGVSIGVEFKHLVDEGRQAILQFVAGQKYLL